MPHFHSLSRFYAGALAGLHIISALSMSIVATARDASSPSEPHRKDAKICRSIVLDPLERMRACNRALDGKAGPEKAALLLARSEIKEQDLDDRFGAITDADAAAAENPMDVAAQNMRCWLRGLADIELQDGRLACEAAIALVPDMAAIYDSTGLISLREMRWQDAWRHYDRAVSLDQAQLSYRYGRGLAALALGRSRDAQQDLSASRLAAPDYAVLGLDPIAISMAASGKQNGAESRLTAIAYLETKARAVEVTVDGKPLEAWVLVDSYPDNRDASELAQDGPVEICLRTTGSKACHILKKGETGVYIIRYRGKSYLAHFIA